MEQTKTLIGFCAKVTYPDRQTVRYLDPVGEEVVDRRPVTLGYAYSALATWCERMAHCPVDGFKVRIVKVFRKTNVRL